MLPARFPLVCNAQPNPSSRPREKPVQKVPSFATCAEMRREITLKALALAGRNCYVQAARLPHPKPTHHPVQDSEHADDRPVGASRCAALPPIRFGHPQTSGHEPAFEKLRRKHRTTGCKSALGFVLQSHVTRPEW